jgi:hypothetical protein
MRFTILTAVRSESAATRGEAVTKAVQMMGAGLKDVRITDTDTGRIYETDEFHLLVQNQ